MTTKSNTAVIAMGGKNLEHGESEDFFESNEINIKINTVVSVTEQVDAAEVYVQAFLPSADRNLADINGVQVSIVKAANATGADAMFGEGVGYFRISYLLP